MVGMLRHGRGDSGGYPDDPYNSQASPAGSGMVRRDRLGVGESCLRGLSGQWVQGAAAGAIIATTLCMGGWVFGGMPDKPAALPNAAERHPAEGAPRCPVFNGVTGETTVPPENPPKPKKVVIKPGEEYPIESSEWRQRVARARNSKSLHPKGATADEIGLAARTARFLSAISSSDDGTGSGEVAEGRVPGGDEGGRSKHGGGGVSAVLTLLEPGVHEAVLGDGWRVSEVEGDGAVAWQEIVVCNDADAEGAADGDAWRQAEERGAIIRVGCERTQEEDRAANRYGELTLACVGADASSAEWVWVPGPELAADLKSWPDKVGGAQSPAPWLISELLRVASVAGAGAAVGFKGWARHPGTTRGGERSWSWVPISGDNDKGPAGRMELKRSGVVEVDALTGGMFVRGSDLRHACSLMGGGRGQDGDGPGPAGSRRGLSREQRGVGVDVVGEATLGGGVSRTAPGNGERRRRLAEGGPPSAMSYPSAVDEMTLSAASYVLRRALGVRSFVHRLGLGATEPKLKAVWHLFGGKEQIPASEAALPGTELLPESCLRPSSGEPVLFAVSSVSDVAALQELIGEFFESDVYDPYVVIAPKSPHLPESDMWELLDSVASAIQPRHSRTVGPMRPELCATVHLSGILGFQGADGVTRGGGAAESTGSGGGAGDFVTREDQWARLLRRLSPVAVIAVSDAGSAVDVRAVKRTSWGASGDDELHLAARRACGNAESPTAFIRMPAQDAKAAGWLASMPPEALASWARPRFSASVITNNRPESLKRLLESMLSARLFGDELAVDFYVESSADDETLQTIEKFSFLWGKRGLVQTHYRVLKGGLIRAVTESFYPADRHHHGFLLEDDVEVSPQFYTWGKWATLMYQYGAEKDFERNMYGVSLYTPRVNELSKHRYVYDSNELIRRKTGGARFSPYLHQTPCSWGAVYFPETWKEYRLYLAARLREDHISVNIMNSKTNKWKTSWKRFHIEMSFQAEYYMLYPNYHNQTSFSTNWLESGEHIKDPLAGGKEDSGKGPPPPKTKGDKTHLPKDYTVPLVADGVSLVDPLPGRRLPPLGRLPRLNVLNEDVRGSQ